VNDSDNFASCACLADELIGRTTKEQLADVARLLALNIAWYHERYGDVPEEELLTMVRTEMLTDETQRLLLHGMQDLVSALGEVMGVRESGDEQARH
jgi:hypothetical protein